MQATDLTCEYTIDPLGIDVPHPRLGWVLCSDQRGQMQSAYQVLVGSSAANLEADTGDKWDSGKVDSDQSVHVPYGGAALSSGEVCWWKVRVWDAEGEASAHSEPATFEMGLLTQSDWEGEWIGADASISAPLLRKEFTVSKEMTRARAYISGLGWHELYLNGEKVGDHVLDPATTDYAKRVLYVTHDVTDLLREGANAVGVMLGNGWYCEPGWETPYGDSPRLLVQLNVEYGDGSRMRLATDGTWRASAGPILKNDLYGGEVYDARLERPGWAAAGYDDSGWSPAATKGDPGGQLRSQLMPAIKVNQTIKPVNLTDPQPGVYVYDMGQLFGGWARLRLTGETGAQVSIKYSARIFEDSGLIDKRRHQKGNETDTYIAKGDPAGEVYEPRFTYHPVQYVQIEGYPGEPTIEDLDGRVVHSSVDLSGVFESSDPIVNQIHQNVVWTMTNGLFGIPLDCLHREHWAWTDPATIVSTLYPRFYMPGFWTKWLGDIKDAQHENGGFPDFAPEYVRRDWFDAAWGGNYPLLVWYLYQYYGDVRMLEEHYDGTGRWVDYLTSIAQRHLISEGHYGDHMMPGDAPGLEEFVSSETLPPLVWTGYYYRGALAVAQAAQELGNDEDAARYAGLADSIMDAFNREWFDPDNDEYAQGSQTGNLYPLILGIVPEGHEDGVVANIVSNIVGKHGGHHHTGNTGATCLIDALTAHGHGDLLYRVITTPTYPSWGYIVAEGATTIWESWSLLSKVGDSESMIMYASVDEFFFNDLAEIRGPEYRGTGRVSPGFREIHIEPHVLGGLDHAYGSIRTVRGAVSSKWTREADGIRLDVAIPVNSRATVSVPKMGLTDVIVTEGGEPVWTNSVYGGGARGITGGVESDSSVVFDVGSGTYSFRLTSAAI